MRAYISVKHTYRFKWCLGILQANADVNARCFDGNTPLHIACGRGLIGMVALLMTAGANPDLENEEVPSEDEKAADSESEELEDNHPRRCQRGLQPIDYAAGNDKVCYSCQVQFNALQRKQFMIYAQRWSVRVELIAKDGLSELCLQEKRIICQNLVFIFCFKNLILHEQDR